MIRRLLYFSKKLENTTYTLENTIRIEIRLQEILKTFLGPQGLKKMMATSLDSPQFSWKCLGFFYYLFIGILFGFGDISLLP